MQTCVHIRVNVYVHIDACQCSELILLNIMTNVIFILYLILIDDMVKESVSYTYHFCLFHNLYTY